MSPVILWLRQDLRLHDNPALMAAIQSNAPIIPVYILDDITPGKWKMGAASRVWLHHSLTALNKSLFEKIVFMVGDPAACLDRLITQTNARGIYWNRCYEPYATTRDTKIKDQMKSRGIDVQSFVGNMLFEPWTITKSDGTPYRVFTPFWRRGCLGDRPRPARPLPPPDLSAGQIMTVPTENIGIDGLKLLPLNPRWDVPMMMHWTPGEQGAQKRCSDFIDNTLLGYKEGRNIPGRAQTSRLSPHLHFGEISVRRIFEGTMNAAAHDPRLELDADTFLSEIGWREFSNHLLYHNPTLPEKPLQPAFEKFPWADPNDAHQSELIARWKRGQTGVAIVDAGMRELWATGYMHNRVRMIVGSYLVKNMLTHWHVGEDWFWDTLVDADLPNNAASWQWIAGCGADAAPYYRIFNPTLQAEKFDPDSDYIRTWVPEINTPRYPKPMIDHASARDRALAAFKSLKS